MSEAAVALLPFADRLAATVGERRSQLVVGLDPQLDLLPLELRGDAHLGRAAAAEACSRFCCGGLGRCCGGFIWGIGPTGTSISTGLF